MADRGRRSFGAITLRAAAAAVLCAASARAAAGPGGMIVSWTNLGNGFFDDGSNWDTGASPGAADFAVFDFGGQSVVTFRRTEGTRALRVENHQATFNLQGFNYFLSDAGPGALRVGAAGAPLASLTILNGILAAPTLQLAPLQTDQGRIEVGPGGSLFIEQLSDIGGEMRVIPGGRFDGGARMDLRFEGRLTAPQVFVGAAPSDLGRARTATLSVRAGAHVEFTSQYVQDAQGTLEATLSNMAPPPVAGGQGFPTGAALAGALVTRAAPGFDVPPGASVPIVAAGVIDGAFGVVVTPRLPKGRFLTPEPDLLLRGPGVYALNGEEGAAEIDLAASAITLTVGEPVEVATGDIDLDGDVDVIVASTFGPGVPGQAQVFLNNGVDGGGAWLGLSAGPVVSVGLDPSAVSVADLDNDGDLDIATSNRGSNNISVLLNRIVPLAALTFATSTRAVGLAPSDLVIAQLSADAFRDIAVSNKGSDTVTLLLNNGSGSFPGSIVAGVADEPETVDAGDLDNDKDIDVVTGNSGSSLRVAGGGTISVLLRTPGGFNDAVNTPVGAGPSSLALADLDADGFLDVTVTNRAGGTVTFLKGDGTAQPQLAGCPSLGGNPDSIVARDIDGDGDPELVALVDEGSARVARVLRNDRLAPGPFVLASASSLAPPGGGGSALGVGDLNQDGKPDVVVIRGSALRGAGDAAIAPLLALVTPTLPADLNGDGFVNAADLAILLGSWGPCGGCGADLTGDHAVNAADLAELLGAWR